MTANYLTEPTTNTEAPPVKLRLSRRLLAAYNRNFRDIRRERIFLAAVSFFCTFACTRLITHAIHIGRGPFHNIFIGARHIHHMVMGIFVLLLTGYLWLAQVGIGDPERRWPSRLTSLAYGFGAALTLDEFALGLNLRDVYWSIEGRASIDAVIIFGTLLCIALVGARFFFAIGRELIRVTKLIIRTSLRR